MIQLVIRLIIMVGIVISLTGLSIGKVSDTQLKINKIKQQAKSNDWVGIKQTYKEIVWKNDNIVESFKSLSKEIPKNKNTKELRRRMKTKYNLLKEDDDPDIEGFNDITAYKIPIVLFDSIDFPAVDVPSVDVPFVQINNFKYKKAMSTWENRWGIALDAVGINGMRIVPNPRTALGQRRITLIKAVRANGWTKETDVMWAKYYNDLSIALGRIHLKKKRK